MFRLYSKKCEYVVRALLCAVMNEGSKRFRAREICSRAKIPEAYSRKVFQALVQGGFLRAVLGPGGGYEFTRPPKDITLLEVIRAVDGEDTFSGCIVGLPYCGSKGSCPLHEVWKTARVGLLDQLGAETLYALAARHAGRTRTAAPRGVQGKSKACAAGTRKKSV